MAISDQLDLTLQTKEGLKGVIEDNGQTAPTKFSQYPAALDSIIDNMRDQLKIADFIIINDDTTLASLNSFFEFLPSVPAGSTTTTQATAEVVASNLNVRYTGSASGSYAGLLVKGDVVNVYGAASSGWYKINQWRNSSTGALTNHGNNYAYISNNSSYVKYYPSSTISNKKQIDISSTDGISVQQKCNYVLAETKGWEVLFDETYKPGTGSAGASTTTERTTDYSFNNCYTENYSSSSYGNRVSTNTSAVRQGYYSGYYYYKGNFRFTSSRLSEIKSILNNSTVKSVQIYVQRANTAHGTSGSAALKLYACNSSGSYSDVLVDGSSTLARGGGKWITLSSDVVNGFKTGKYDHFKAYYPSTSLSYYIVFALNAKLRITYTA
jgi:hypothetical protein